MRVRLKVVAIGLDGDDDGAHYKKVLLDYGIDVLPVTGKYLLDLKRITTLIHLMRQGEIDLIQTHLSYANILGVLAGRLAGLPVVGHPSFYRCRSAVLPSRSI